MQSFEFSFHISNVFFFSYETKNSNFRKFQSLVAHPSLMTALNSDGKVHTSG